MSASGFPSYMKFQVAEFRPYQEVVALDLVVPIVYIVRRYPIFKTGSQHDVVQVGTYDGSILLPSLICRGRHLEIGASEDRVGVRVLKEGQQELPALV